MNDVVIREPLTYVERQVAIAFVKLGYVVEILPRKEVIDFKPVEATDDS